VFHRVETRALRLLFCGMPFQVGGRCRFPFLGTRTDGMCPSLHQTFFSSNLLAFRTAIRGFSAIGEGVMRQIVSTFNTTRLRLERGVARRAVKGNLGRGFGTVYRHGAQYCVSCQARNREDYGEALRNVPDHKEF
jgi:hypothetical protein